MKQDFIIAKKALVELGAREGVPLSELVSFRVGGPAALVLSPEEEGVLAQALALCHDAGLPVALLGNGTNVLPYDEGFGGLVLCLHRLSAVEFEGEKVVAQGGASLTALAKRSVQRGLMGLERLCGIPGTVGGAVAMNAGAYGGEIRSLLRRVRLYEQGVFEWVEADLSAMGYRKSPYSWPHKLVTAAELALLPDDGTAASTMETCLNSRREKQPVQLPSAGSTFKRPAGHFAGGLIESCGLKGHRQGGAQVSSLHAGFIVNAGGATAKDIWELMAFVQQRVWEQTGVHLEPEVKSWEEITCIF